MTFRWSSFDRTGTICKSIENPWSMFNDLWVDRGGPFPDQWVDYEGLTDFSGSSWNSPLIFKTIT